MSKSEFIASFAALCVIISMIGLIAANDIKRKRIQILEKQVCKSDKIINCTVTTVDGETVNLCRLTDGDPK